MIRPSKHIDLNLCVLRAASIALAKLHEERICTYTALRESLAELGDEAELSFYYAVHLLFLLGRVEYHAQTDSLEYIQPASAT